MKKNIFYILLSFASIGFSQTYNIATENGNTINDCSGTFVDSGGTGGDYSANENYTVTFCPDTPGDLIVLDFNAGTFSIEGSIYDFLTVYNGDTTGSPLYGTFTGNPGIISSSHASGCLTISFESESLYEYSGWEAAISCQTPCTDTIVANLVSTTPAVNGIGVVTVCQGDSVDFVGSGTFSGTSAGSTYDWNFGDGNVASGTNVSNTFNTPGVFLVNLDITNGLCQSTNRLNQIVQVSPTPDFTGTSATSSTICLGSTTTITGMATPSTLSGTCAPPLVQTTFLPDSSTGSYSTCITVDCYGPGETITSAADLVNVFFNMEHSYMGDLQLSLTAPNGSTAIMHTDGFGGGTNLGDPDQNDGTGPGTGWDYFIVEAGTTGVDLENGPTVVNGTGSNSLTSGTYDSDNSFAAFIGSPINGDWCFTIEDSLGSDDGYIFAWNVNFNPAITPIDPNLTFTQIIASDSWVANDGNGNITGTAGSTITVQPTTIGNHCYTYTVVDGFGCSYDQIVCIDVNAGATADATVVTTPICDGNDAVFNITGTANATVTYNINGGGDQTIVLDGTGNATVTVSGVSADQTINLISVVTSAAPTVGNGISATGGVNPTNAVGTMQPVGTALSAANAVEVTGASTSLVITLADVVPAGTVITISIARNNNPGAVDITDGTNTQSFSAGPNDTSQQITFTTGVATNTITINRTGGSVWIDGVEYTITTTTCTVPLTDSETVVVTCPIPVFVTPPTAVAVECITDVPAMIDLTWNDNCTGTGTVTGSDAAIAGGNCGGTITRTWTYTNGCGNSDTVTQVITVDDTIAPVLAVAPGAITVECIGDVPVMVDLGYTDNCDAAGTVTGSDAAIAGNNCGGTITRTWTFTDTCGNIDTVTQVITIDDTIAPVLVAEPGDITVQCIGDVPAMVNLAYTDNCDPAGVVAGTDAALVGTTCSGTITRTWSFTDTCGNVDTATQTITIGDTINPTGTAPGSISVSSLPADDVTLITDEADNCTVTPTVIFVGDVSDNGTCPEIVTRTYRITDDCGNTTDLVQIITIGDATPPTASNPLPASYQCAADVLGPDPALVTDEADNGATPTVTWEDDTPNGLTCPMTIIRR
ncbi:MAG: hypothetical protein COA88_16010, partial [Kordia sp.]